MNLPWVRPTKTVTLAQLATLGMQRVPGGSSGGSAAAAAAGLVACATGTDTGGSFDNQQHCAASQGLNRLTGASLATA